MQALAAAGIEVPAVVPTDRGEPFVKCEVEGIREHVQVDLFEWIDGTQLGSVEEGVADGSDVESLYRRIGSLAAAVHNQASGWAEPGGFTRHAWDAEGLAGEQPFWGRFWEIEAASDEQRALLTRTRKHLYRQLSILPQSADGYSMIHADLAPENVMVHGDVARLIDFDDAGYGWHVFELVTAVYFIFDEPYYEQALRGLLDGYRTVRPLSETRMSQWDLMMTARSLTYVGWVHTRSGTETARELTPPLLDSACRHCERYLSTAKP